MKLKCTKPKELLQYHGDRLDADLADLDAEAFRAWLKVNVLAGVEAARAALTEASRSAANPEGRRASLERGLLWLLAASYCKPAEGVDDPTTLTFKVGGGPSGRTKKNPPKPRSRSRKRPKTDR